MIAAIYARKSTEQTGVADEQKSVARQIEHGRADAARQGWTVDDAHVFVDALTDKFMMSAVGVRRELEREKARQRVTDTMPESRAGHVAAAGCSATPTSTSLGPDGKRSHVERVITPRRRQSCAESRLVGEGTGFTRIAKC